MFSVADYFNVDVLIGIRFIKNQVKSMRCIDRQVKFRKGKIPLLCSAPNEPKINRLKSMKDDYSGMTTDILAQKMDCYSDIMRHKVALRKHVTLSTPFYIISGRDGDQSIWNHSYGTQELPVDETFRPPSQ